MSDLHFFEEMIQAGVLRPTADRRYTGVLFLKHREKFFMYDLYPENRERFPVAYPDVLDFKPFRHGSHFCDLVSGVF